MKHPRVDLRRIDPATSSDAESLDGVLVIFIAPYEDGQRVVGWYRDAKVYRVSVQYPPNVKDRIQQHFAKEGLTNPTFNEYRLEAKLSNAVLLPKNIRMSWPKIPRGTGGIGQSNVCYAYEANRALKSASWIQEVFDLVSSYHGPNLLTAPEAEADDEIFNAQEQAWGFQSNAEIRRLVEEHAMQKAKEELHNLGFGKFVRTAELECYDYTCERSGALHYVEVKGTQTAGTSVILTRNEVEHAKQHPGNSMFVIVHSIKVCPKGSSFDASGGTSRVHAPWMLNSDELEPINFRWVVPGV